MFIFNHREKSIVNVSILNWVMKLSLFMCFSFFLFLKHPWMIFHSIHLLFLFFGLDTYKHALRKVAYIFLVNFSPKLSMKLFQENPRKMYFQVICRAKFQNFSLHCLPWGHPAISKLEMAISWFSLADSSLDSWFLGWLWLFENIG